MPEGPSIVLLKEEVKQFTGKKIIALDGNTSINKGRLLNQNILAFKSWGKHFLVCFSGFSVRIHFLMFGSYRINEQKDKPARLSIKFSKGEINFYTCSIKILEGDVNEHYDFSADVMNDEWNASKAKKKLKDVPNIFVCDAVLEQDFFSGVGNIIKNEVLYRVKIHPESLVGSIPGAKIKEMIAELRHYSFEFLDWKRNYELKKHWLVYNKKTCIRCKVPIETKYTGIKKRRSFFCSNCQVLYA